MLSGMVLILGQTGAAIAARELCFGIARDLQVPIVGLSIIDPEVVAPAEPTPLGGDAYKAHKDEAALAKAREQAAEAQRLLKTECQRYGLSCETMSVEGASTRAAVETCAVHDLVIAGHDLPSGQHTSESFLFPFLRDNPRPALICSADASDESGPTLVAYDGSVAAMRALQLFALLELRKRRRVVVLTIHDQQDSAALISRSAVEYLSKHGYDASASPLAGNSAIESLISVTATQMGAGLIVAGAYGHQRLRELFLGSTTRRLIESCKTPLFIHH